MVSRRPCGRCGHLMQDVSAETPPAQETEHGAQQADQRRFKCPECGAEEASTEPAPADAESWENEGGSAWGRDEGPWEG